MRLSSICRSRFHPAASTWLAIIPPAARAFDPAAAAALPLPPPDLVAGGRSSSAVAAVAGGGGGERVSVASSVERAEPGEVEWLSGVRGGTTGTPSLPGTLPAVDVEASEEEAPPDERCVEGIATCSRQHGHEGKRGLRQPALRAGHVGARCLGVAKL